MELKKGDLIKLTYTFQSIGTRGDLIFIIGFSSQEGKVQFKNISINELKHTNNAHIEVLGNMIEEGFQDEPLIRNVKYKELDMIKLLYGGTNGRRN